MTAEAKVVLGITVATIVLLVGLVMAGTRSSNTQFAPATTFPDSFEVGQLVNEGDFQSGSATAKVTLVNFSDFECSYCRELHPVLTELRDLFTDDELRIVYRHLPITEIHQEAYPAAVAAQAATNQGKFKEFADAFFGNVPRLGEDFYQSVAEEVGLNIEQFNSDRADQNTQWQAFRAREYFIEHDLPIQTPTIFINGALYTEARELSVLESTVRALLNN